MGCGINHEELLEANVSHFPQLYPIKDKSNAQLNSTTTQAMQLPQSAQSSAPAVADQHRCSEMDRSPMPQSMDKNRTTTQSNQIVLTTSGGSRIISKVKTKPRASQSEAPRIRSLPAESGRDGSAMTPSITPLIDDDARLGGSMDGDSGRKRGSHAVTGLVDNDDDDIQVVKRVRGDNREEMEAAKRLQAAALSQASDVKHAVISNDARNATSSGSVSLTQMVRCDLCRRDYAYVLGIGPIHHDIACHGKAPIGKPEIPLTPEFNYDRCGFCHLFFDTFSFSFHKCSYAR